LWPLSGVCASGDSMILCHNRTYNRNDETNITNLGDNAAMAGLIYQATDLAGPNVSGHGNIPVGGHFNSL